MAHATQSKAQSRPLKDASQRFEATDPSSSFIVQAPAGSGKTEILTQRFLRLLGTVTLPEQIIALTFTRKAASEMRERIILALQGADKNIEAKSAHQQMTLEFAKVALNRSLQFNWNLLQQTHRLKIYTLDALCQNINQAIPLLEKHMAFSKITDTPSSDYLIAARNCIQFALETPEYHETMRILLLHVDNRQDHLIDLLTDLLMQRDLWTRPLFQAREQEKTQVDQALLCILTQALEQFKSCLPKDLSNKLIQKVQHVARLENDPNSPRYILKDWQDLQQTSPDIVKALSTLLLTGEGKYRTSFDHHVGLKREGCAPSEYVQLKAESKELLAELNECPDFLKSLKNLLQSPPQAYDEDQWKVLQALFHFLPLLLGHLHLYFGEQNAVDFTYVSQLALMALGGLENPTDLALYMDNALHHILVDEFQDTSMNQFELISKLVQGWQPHEGKTLFIVGDPMQSIYRFRQAEVGLFFKAKEEGIGPVRLKSLQLECNFRSTPALVQWVNEKFHSIFPSQSNIESGAVSFTPSTSVINSQEEPGIFAQKFDNKTFEAEGLIQQVKRELELRPEQSMAILVRSRTHLTEIIRRLRQENIPYQGNEIDLLATLPHIRDVFSLTEALLMPANRLAWLSMLRSPYCGMTFKDILCIAGFNKKLSIYHALLHLDEIQDLSEEGRLRAAYFTKVMRDAEALRFQQPLSDWVIETLNHLQVEKILTQKQLKDLEQFWVLLDTYEQDGRLPDMKEFTEKFNKLYSQQVSPARLQVMTIHKSKGLEFDTVFLPGLGSLEKSLDKPFLRWLKITNPPDLILLSPIAPANKEACALYDYLGFVEEEKALYESQRLLYVAVTRAKSRLYLMDGSSKTSKNSFLGLLKNQEFMQNDCLEPVDAIKINLPQLSQLPIYHVMDYQTLSTSRSKTSTLGLWSHNSRLAGILSHRLMQWICEHHPEDLNHIPWQLLLYEFKKMGLDEANQKDMLSNIQKQMSQVFQDPRGLWIIKKQTQEKNEYELLVEQDGSIVTRIIDRTFVEGDAFWIIDFKTGKDDKNALAKNQQQLEAYKSHLSSRTKLTIHCGLYYLNNGHWLEW